MQERLLSCRIQQFEGGIEARLDRPLTEKPVAKGMDSPDDGGVDFGDRRVQSVALGSVLGRSRSYLQLFAESSGELRRRFLRKGDRRELADGGRSRLNQGNHAIHEAGRLPGARRCMNGEAGTELLEN